MSNIMREYYVDQEDTSKVYFRPPKPSLVKKGFNKIKTWTRSKVTWG